MDTKTTEKPEHKQAKSVPPPEEMQAVFECHTLAQILYGQIAAAHPWLFQMSPTPTPPMRGLGAAPSARPGVG